MVQFLCTLAGNAKNVFYGEKIHITSGSCLSASSFFCEGKVSAQNAFDAEGKKTGPWIITGDISKQKGYADAAKVEEGEYKRSRKVGVWIKYWPNGEKES